MSARRGRPTRGPRGAARRVRRRNDERQLRCGTHGMVRWDGEAICTPRLGGCATVQRIVAGADPLVCCEAFDREDPSKTLRAICRHCFEAAGGQGGKLTHH